MGYFGYDFRQFSLIIVRIFLIIALQLLLVLQSHTTKRLKHFPPPALTSLISLSLSPLIINYRNSFSSSGNGIKNESLKISLMNVDISIDCNFLPSFFILTLPLKSDRKKFACAFLFYILFNYPLSLFLNGCKFIC